jgi:membrane-associated phospholipid phosphatase
LLKIKENGSLRNLIKLANSTFYTARTGNIGQLAQKRQFRKKRGASLMKSSHDRLLPAPTLPSDRAMRHVLTPVMLVVAAAAVLPLDFAVGHWAVNNGCPRFFRELFEAAEPFGNGNGVAYIALAVFVLAPLRRRAIPRILATAYGAGLAADVIKLFVERTRPRAFVFEGTIWDSFVGVLPLTSAGSSGQSFPSAHTATAVGLAAGLTWLCPRGRFFFLSMAVLVATQRVTSGAHFISDAFCGAAVGCVVASFTLRYGRLAARFDRFEAKGTAETEQACEPNLQE